MEGVKGRGGGVHAGDAENVKFQISNTTYMTAIYRGFNDTRAKSVCVVWTSVQSQGDWAPSREACHLPLTSCKPPSPNRASHRAGLFGAGGEKQLTSIYVYQ